MKTLVLLYAPVDEPVVLNKVVSWAKKITPAADAVEICGPYAEKMFTNPQNDFCGSPEVTLCRKELRTGSDLLALIASYRESGYENVVFAFADCPFLNVELTEQLLAQHLEYGAEYSLQEGFPFGLVPEILNTGTAKILSSLISSGKNQKMKEEAEKALGNSTIFSVIKTDINSFEIETLVAEEDFRLFRLDFSVRTKRNRLMCERVESLIKDKNLSALEICRTAAADPLVLHTLPAYFSVEICSEPAQKSVYQPFSPDEVSPQFMDIMQFKQFMADAASFSGDGVVSLSVWGEPLLHSQLPEFVKSVLGYSGFSVLIETSAISENDEMQKICDQVSEIAEKCAPRTNGYAPVMWICQLDAATQDVYEQMHPETCAKLETVQKNAAILEKAFPGSVYRQFVRTTINENQLESFFRGNQNRLIQKYDSYCGFMPCLKPADLSPVTRNPCWHLRRDMTILADGSVPLCRECRKSEIIGNVFAQGVADLWEISADVLKNHLSGKYSPLCELCDEYYTYNF
ncbi:MAG: spiro-SPASM protein [Treponemataceae bacterium]|nr:spiro-SPASM protein [Treponemataceae bacterium]